MIGSTTIEILFSFWFYYKRGDKKAFWESIGKVSPPPTFIPRPQFPSRFRVLKKTKHVHFNMFQGTRGWPRSHNILWNKALIISPPPLPFSMPNFSSLLFVHHWSIHNKERSQKSITSLPGMHNHFHVCPYKVEFFKPSVSLEDIYTLTF